MVRNILFRTLFIFALAVFMLNCGTSKNMNTTVKNYSMQAGLLQVGYEAQQSSDQDAGITSEIKMKFANDEVVSTAKIHVDTSDRSVKLTGLVMSQVIADRALYLARSVDGVKSVHSLLVVNSRNL
jgi:osmotically-inducible protein OsmY